MGPRLSVRRALVAALACGAIACGLGTSGLMDVEGDASTLPTTSPDATSGTGGDAGGVSPAPGTDAAPGEPGSTDDSSSSSPVDSTSPPPPDSSMDSTDVGTPDVHVLNPDASYEDAGDECDLDQDGYRATGGECGGTDCCDFDGRAYPGETSFYATQDACGSFDYDCNTHDEPEYGLVNCTLGVFTCSGDGFDKTPPPCGASATFDTCANAVVFCSTQQGSKAQVCR